jgi:ribulose-5-phosphate 4-epimerase/fuculose-1-phosphate aldolase
MPSKNPESIVDMKDTQVIEELALTHQIIADLGLDDLTYTHITMRSHDHPGHYYIGRLGPLFSQITPNDILLIQPDGHIANNPHDYIYNLTGHFVHKGIYEARPEVNAVIHTHTPDTIAIASMDGGLEFYCQFSYLFFDNISYMTYDALALDDCPQIPQSLGKNAALLMENHGAITVGKTIYEALFFTMFLEKAAQVQLKMMASNGKPICVPKSVCAAARDQMINFEEDIGKRDWIALKDKILN